MLNKSPEILVTFDEEGDPTIEVLNGDGKTCTELTSVIEDALGTVAKREFKAEHRQHMQVQNRLSVRH